MAGAWGFSLQHLHGPAAWPQALFCTQLPGRGADLPVADSQRQTPGASGGVIHKLKLRRRLGGPSLPPGPAPLSFPAPAALAAPLGRGTDGWGGCFGLLPLCTGKSEDPSFLGVSWGWLPALSPPPVCSAGWTSEGKGPAGGHVAQSLSMLLWLLAMLGVLMDTFPPALPPPCLFLSPSSSEDTSEPGLALL